MLAWPELLMVAVPISVPRGKVAEAPLAGAANMMSPPATGSSCRHAYSSDYERGREEGADSSLLIVAARNVEGKAARIKRADVDHTAHDVRVARAALVGRDAGWDGAVVARIDGGASGKQSESLGRPAVIPQALSSGSTLSRSELAKPLPPDELPIRLLPLSVVAIPLKSGPVPPVTWLRAMIVLTRVSVPASAPPLSMPPPSFDEFPLIVQSLITADPRPCAVGEDAAALAVRRFVVGDGAVDQRERADVGDPPAVCVGQVVVDRAIGHHQRADVLDPAPLTAGAVRIEDDHAVRDGAVLERHRAGVVDAAAVYGGIAVKSRVSDHDHAGGDKDSAAEITVLVPGNFDPVTESSGPES